MELLRKYDNTAQEYNEILNKFQHPVYIHIIYFYLKTGVSRKSINLLISFNITYF